MSTPDDTRNTDPIAELSQTTGLSATITDRLGTSNTVGVVEHVDPGTETRSVTVNASLLADLVAALEANAEYDDVWLTACGPDDDCVLAATDHRCPIATEDHPTPDEVADESLIRETVLAVPGDAVQTLVATNRLQVAVDALGATDSVHVHVDDAGLVALDVGDGTGVLITPVLTTDHPAVDADTLPSDSGVRPGDAV